MESIKKIFLSFIKKNTFVKNSTITVQSKLFEKLSGGTHKDKYNNTNLKFEKFKKPNASNFKYSSYTKTYINNKWEENRRYYSDETKNDSNSTNSDCKYKSSNFMIIYYL